MKIVDRVNLWFKRIVKEAVKEADIPGLVDGVLSSMNQPEMVGSCVFEALREFDEEKSRDPTDRDRIYTEMTRELLHGVRKESIDIDSLDPREREELLKSAHAVMNERAFKWIIDEVILRQKDFTAMKATERDAYLLGRFTINGAALVQEIMEEFSTRFEALNVKDDFEPNDIV